MTAEINIKKITLRLPAGFEQRAQSISALIARHLSEVSFSKSHEVATMRLPTLQINDLDSDNDIARQVCNAIALQLENNMHNPASNHTEARDVNHA